MKLTQATIAAQVWKACDNLRGTSGAAQFKDYILTMLFIKALSDELKDKEATYQARYRGDPERIARAMRLERFTVPATATFDNLYAHRTEPNLGQVINTALEEIEEANRDKLSGVFYNIDFASEANLGQTKKRNRRLQTLLSDFAGFNLRPSNLESSDVIGGAYERLITSFADEAGKQAMDCYTPSEVSTLLAKLVEPEEGNRICDPTCGYGSLLLATAREVGNKNVSLYGQEADGSSWALARMNMVLHGMDSATIAWGDTINNPKLLENDALMRFDVVVAHPPASLNDWGAKDATADVHNRFRRGVPPRSKGDYAFITHVIETLNGGGRAGVVVPYGVLFRGGAEGKLRKQLIQENLISAVIGLPGNLFYGTVAPAVILIFDKAKGDDTSVVFIDASADFVSGKNRNRLSKAHIQVIYDTYHERITQDKYSYLATRAEIAENNYNLNIPRYVDTFEEDSIDVERTRAQIASLKVELAGVEAELAEHLKELGL